MSALKGKEDARQTRCVAFQEYVEQCPGYRKIKIMNYRLLTVRKFWSTFQRHSFVLEKLADSDHFEFIAEFRC